MIRAITMDDSRFRGTVNLAPSMPFFAWVFTFSGTIRIEGPSDVLDEMREMARGLTG